MSTTTTAHTFWFSAMHVIPGLPEWHPEARSHGHSYTLSLEFSAPPDAGVVEEIRVWVAQTLDHQYLNTVTGTSTTPEHVAMWIHEQLAEKCTRLAAVAVSARPGEWAEYRPDPPGVEPVTELPVAIPDQRGTTGESLI